MDATRSVTMLVREAIAWRPWRRRVSRVMTRSSVPAAIRLPDWISTTWVSSGRSSQQALIFASCEVSSAMTTFEPESDRMWWTSSVPVVGYTVVVAAPEHRIPRSARIHSSRVLDAIATRSSDSTPSEISPAAISVTAEEVWVQVKDSHSFLALRRRNASAVPLPSTRCRNIAASEAGASAATCSRCVSSSDGAVQRGSPCAGAGVGVSAVVIRTSSSSSTARPRVVQA